jgi:hypothetical protein
VISPLASPSLLECEEGKRFMEEISETIKCVDEIGQQNHYWKGYEKEFSKGQYEWRQDLVQQHKNLWRFKGPTTKMKKVLM